MFFIAHELLLAKAEKWVYLTLNTSIQHVHAWTTFTQPTETK